MWLLKRVVSRILRFRKIWAERKSCRQGSVSGVAHDDEEYTEVAEEGRTKGEEEVSIMSLSEAFQDDAGTSLVSLNKSLPEEVVERILAMVPFPEVCKARTLSKSWQARFSPLESHDDEEKKRLAVLFQKRVRLQSINWRPPCPFFLDLRGELFYGYSSASQNWPKMPSLSFFPPAVRNDRLSPPQTVYYPYYPLQTPLALNRDIGGDIFYRPHFKCLEVIDGALFFLATVISRRKDRRYLGSSPLKLRVANLLTQTWRQLPQAPRALEDKPFVKLVSQPALEKYKVIVFNTSCRNFFAQCYDSKSDSWRTTTAIPASRLECRTRPAHLDGMLYMIVNHYWTRLLAFNVEEETFEELELVGVGSWWTLADLVVCNGNLLMTAQNSDNPRTVHVLKIDLGSREVSEVARGPPDALTVGRCTHLQIESVVSDGVTSICFRLFSILEPKDAMVVYDMRTDKWQYVVLPGKIWVNSSYQTNCNPFLAV